MVIQYRTVSSGIGQYLDEGQLNALGAADWELVSVSQAAGDLKIVYIFKK